MGAARQHDVVELPQLIGQRRTNVGVAVTKQVDPPRADGIQIALPFRVIQPRPLRTRNRQQRLGFMAFHGGARVPDGSEAAGGEVGGIHWSFPESLRMGSC